MKNIIPYSSFDSIYESILNEDVNSEKILAARKKYGISDEQWEAMRKNPEDKENYDKYKEHYQGKGARDLVDKILSLVCFYIFNDDKNMKFLMMGIAKAESCYGTNPETYKRKGFTKGIFQMDKRSSLKTIGYEKSPMVGNHLVKKRLNSCRSNIKNKIDLDWSKVPYDSISKPLYSAIASRMYIEVKLQSYEYDAKTNKTTPKDHPIGSSRKQYANWWKERYNSSKGAGTVNHFLNPPGCSI